MKKFYVEKTCTFRFDGKKSVYLEAGRTVEVEDGMETPPWFIPVATPPDPVAEESAGETAAPVEAVTDIRSKKDVCAELNAMNVVYSKKSSISQLEALLKDAKAFSRKNNE
ncbi:MAG: hypothetical protein WC637_21880 [Victivallales bacterium]